MFKSNHIVTGKILTCITCFAIALYLVSIPNNSFIANASENTDVYYYYNSLDPDQQEIYDCILEGLEMEDSDITFSTTWNGDELATIVTMITNDHPELFWYTGTYQYSWDARSTTLMPEYTISSEEKEKRQQEIESNTAEILARLSEQSSDYDKVKMTFEYLVDTVNYDINSSDNQNIYSSLVNKSTVCAGYARATQYLLQKVGIQCLFIEGSTDSGSHSWNIVRCDGTYYQVDTTYGDLSFTEGSSLDLTSMPENLRYEYVYLCTNDDTMLRNRSVSNLLPIPACASDALNYYKLNNLYFADISSAETALQNSISNGEHGFDCQLADEETYSHYMSDIADHYYAQSILNIVPGITSVSASYTYDDVHYTVKVWY